MLASLCRRHGKRAPEAPNAKRLTSYRVLETAPKAFWTQEKDHAREHAWTA
jgi:hypothetical protein